MARRHVSGPFYGILSGNAGVVRTEVKTSRGVNHLAAIYGAKCTGYPDRSARRWTGTLSYPGKVDVFAVGSRRATFDVSYAEKSDFTCPVLGY